MATGNMERGPTGRLVAENVRSLREAQGLSLDDLAERLEEHGHPIIASGLSKLERAARRIDVDDLAAIAAALGTTPMALLSVDADGDVSLSEIETNIVQLAPVIAAAMDASEAGVPKRLVVGAAQVGTSKAMQIFLFRNQRKVDDGGR